MARIIMAIDIQEVLRLAKVGKLRFSDEEIESMRRHISRMTERFELLETTDVSDYEPLEYTVSGPARLREDTAGAPLSKQSALSAAAETDGSAFVVPRVVE